MLRFPPDAARAHLPNPFAKLPPYRYSQLAFKTFSEEEIKNQAGQEALPSVGSRREEDRESSVDPDADTSVRSEKGSPDF